MKIIKQVGLVAAAAFTTGAFANQPDGQVEGHYYQTMDSINQQINPNDADAQINKGFGAGTYYLFVGASGATSNRSSLDYEYGGAGCLFKNGGDGIDGDWDLNLQLPDGHDILGFRFYFNDTSASNVSAYLYKFDGAGGATQIASATSTTDTGYGNVWSGNMNHIVQNSTGSYVLRFEDGANGGTTEVCGARLFIDADPTP